jgi:hypothetical protein
MMEFLKFFLDILTSDRGGPLVALLMILFAGTSILVYLIGESFSKIIRAFKGKN